MIRLNLDHVTSVLLPDGWHDVAPHSFDLHEDCLFHNGELPVAEDNSVALAVPEKRRFAAVWQELSGTRVLCLFDKIIALGVDPPSE